MGKILIIDDEENIRHVFKRALEKANHDVIVAENGRIGEYLYIQQSPDVIILDILMPEQEGIETILRLVAYDQNVKIIAISGGGLGNVNNYLDNALKFGATFALEKPIDIKELVNKVNTLLN